jgi:uncharacterized membrane protein
VVVGLVVPFAAAYGVYCGWRPRRRDRAHAAALMLAGTAVFGARLARFALS